MFICFMHILFKTIEPSLQGRGSTNCMSYKTGLALVNHKNGSGMSSRMGVEMNWGRLGADIQGKATTQYMYVRNCYQVAAA